MNRKYSLRGALALLVLSLSLIFCGCEEILHTFSSPDTEQTGISAEPDTEQTGISAEPAGQDTGSAVDTETKPEDSGSGSDDSSDTGAVRDDLADTSDAGAVRDDQADQDISTEVYTETEPESDAVPATDDQADTSDDPGSGQAITIPGDIGPAIEEGGSYTTREDVAAYIHTYRHLPSNFITKKQAQALGWSGGGLDPYMPGGCIGGDRYNNFEGLLPSGVKYLECDIDTMNKPKRGSRRLVFSVDGSSIYYTADHYSSFEQLY